MSSYIDSRAQGGDAIFGQRVTRSWVQHTLVALRWHYGEERAAAILMRRDPATQSDLAAWNTLGLKDAA